MKKCDVLVLDWTTKLTRDRLAGCLIVNYLRANEVEVVDAPLQNALWSIDYYKPKIILLLNTVGSKAAVKISKYAKQNNYFIISLYGEGNFSEAKIKQFYFGHNLSMDNIDSERLLWSERAFHLVKKHFPAYSNNIHVKGSVGADNHVILRNKKTDLLKKYGVNRKDYSIVLGIGCWDFGLLSKMDHRYEIFTKNISTEEQERISNDGMLFNQTIINLVNEFPNVLFLVKKHPNHYDTISNASAVSGIEEKSNVLIVDKEEAITDCIRESDIWLTYESTTALEAWLADVSTALLNPSGIEFESDWRAKICEGQPNYPDAESWGKAIETYILKGNLLEEVSFKEKKAKILQDSIGFSDGFNHVRVGNFILEKLLLDKGKQEEELKINFKFLIEKHLKNMIWKLNRFLTFLNLGGVITSCFPKRFVSKEWDEKKLEVYMKELDVYQKAHYKCQTLKSIRDIE